MEFSTKSIIYWMSGQIALSWKLGSNKVDFEGSFWKEVCQLFIVISFCKYSFLSFTSCSHYDNYYFLFKK